MALRALPLGALSLSLYVPVVSVPAALLGHVYSALLVASCVTDGGLLSVHVLSVDAICTLPVASNVSSGVALFGWGPPGVVHRIYQVSAPGMHVDRLTLERVPLC